MKKSRIIATLALISALLGSSHALACSYVVDDLATKNELAAKALTELEIDITDDVSIAISDYNWWESKPTPMCPEELTFTATVTVGHNQCFQTVKVTKVSPWTGQPETFSFEVSQKFCLGVRR